MNSVKNVILDVNVSAVNVIFNGKHSTYFVHSNITLEQVRSFITVPRSFIIEFLDENTNNK